MVGSGRFSVKFAYCGKGERRENPRDSQRLKT